MKEFVVGLIVMLMAVGCLAVVGCGKEQQNQQVDKQVEKAIDQEITKQMNSDKESVTQKGSVGEAVRVGNYEIKVVEWKFATPDDFGKSAEDSDEIIVADVEVTNIGSEVDISGLGCMTVKTPEGYTYENGWGYALPKPEFPSCDLDPSEKARGFVTFKVPQNIGSIEFQFDTISDGKARITLQ